MHVHLANRCIRASRNESKAAFQGMPLSACLLSKMRGTKVAAPTCQLCTTASLYTRELGTLATWTGQAQMLCISYVGCQD